MVNQINQQSKEKKALISLILGIVNLVIMIAIELLRRITPIMVLGPIINFVFFQINPLIAIIGLIFGIIELKSIKRNFAITGIILCSIGLLVPLIYFLFY